MVPESINPPAIVKSHDAEMDKLAARAVAALAAGQKAAKTTAERYREAGEALIAAKAKCKHGKWLPWLANNGISGRSASRAIRVAKNWEAKSATLADLVDGFDDLADMSEEKEIPEPQVDKDDEGHEIPDLLVEPFSTRAKFDETYQLANSVQKKLDEISKSPGGEHLSRHLKATGSDGKTINKSEHINSLKRDLKFTRPHSVCPWCLGKAIPGCKGCQGTGWVAKMTWDGAPQDMKEKLNAVSQTVSE